MLERLLAEQIPTGASLLEVGKLPGLDALRAVAVAGPEMPVGRGWYLGVLTDQDDPEYFKKYLGQADTDDGTCRGISAGIMHYEARSRASDPGKSLMLSIWGKDGKNRQIRWVHLGGFPDNPDESVLDRKSWLNIMFYAMFFQTLTKVDLDTWVDNEDLDPVHRGLNVALPLYDDAQGVHRAVLGGRWELAKSADPEYREFVGAA